MKKALIIFVCFLVIMAILVGAGVVQDRGFFGNSDQLFDFVAPFTNKVEMLFRTMFTTVSSPLQEGDLCVIERVHFEKGGIQYYCDLITPCRTALEASGDSYVVDHNYVTILKLVKRNNIRLVLSDENGNEIYNKILIFTARQREIKMMTYGYYCENLKGIEGRLEYIIPSN